MAAVLASAKTPIRKVLLHTCSAGKSKLFIDGMAARLRVRVQAHNDEMVYTGATLGSILAHYSLTPPSAEPGLSQAKVEWPSSRVGAESSPSAQPPPKHPVQ
jgi:hypothetical protein